MTWQLHVDPRFPRYVRGGVSIDSAVMQDGGCYIRDNSSAPGQYTTATRFVVDENGYMAMGRYPDDKPKPKTKAQRKRARKAKKNAKSGQ